MINVYKASAGSGKTYTLVQEYLKLLLGIKNDDGSYRLDKHPNNNHRAILAITFTNKATEEMKKRIVKELDILGRAEADDKENKYIGFLSKTFNVAPEEVRKQAFVALKQLLHDYSNFNVSTIDAFFQLILRTFAHESEIAGNYNLELKDEYAIAVGISDLKQSLRADAPKIRQEQALLVNWLEQFMKSKIDEGKSWDVFRESIGKEDVTLYSFAKNLSKETVKQHRDALYEYLSDKSKIVAFKAELEKRTAIAQCRVKEAASRFAALASSVDAKFNRKFDEKVIALCGDEWKDSQLSYVAGARGQYEKWFTKATLPSVDIATLEAIDGCLGDIAEGAKAMVSYGMVSSHLYLLGLLGDIDANMRQFNTENNVVLLSDTNGILRKIINEDDTPFIYERVGVKLRHFLMDEFQDTSRMQWVNMVPLVRNSLGSGNDNLIIGDVKQSIYRFRNSDPYLLKDEIYKEFPGNIKETGNDIASNTNWRSARSIVLWNNTFFSLLADSLGMGDVYSNVIQQVAGKNVEKEGYVRIECLDDEIAEFKELALERMAEDIQGMLQRGYRQKDIAILVSRNSEGESVIGKLLEYNRLHPDGRQLNVVSEESLRICKASSVKIIVGMLALLDNEVKEKQNGEHPGRNLALLMKQYEYYVEQGIAPSEAIEQALAVNVKEEDLDYLLGANDCAGLDAIVERIVHKYGQKFATEETAYIQAFQDKVIDYMERYGSNLHQFLKWWNTFGKQSTVSSPDNIEAIKVMTIHKSKGLEFPCVIIPFADWEYDSAGLEWIDSSVLTDFDRAIVPPLLPVKRKKKKEDTFFNEKFEKLEHDSIMDSLNKTYVAFTRAVDELIAYYPVSNKEGLADSISRILPATEAQVAAVCGGKIAGIEGQTVITPADYFDGNRRFEMGKPVEQIGPKKEDNAGNIRLMPGYKVNPRSEIWKFDILDRLTESRETPKFKGVAMHNIMCRIQTLGDEGLALRYFRTKGIITAEEEVEFGEIIRNGLSDPRVANWFAPGNKLLRERSILNEKGEEYRPDRVALTPEGKILVIDYKFGEKEEGKYLRQVRNYMRIIASATGNRNIEGYVWYVMDKRIENVPS